MSKVVASILLALSAFVAFAQPQYAVTTVAGTPTSYLSEVYCMNNLGQIAGVYYDVNGLPHAYLVDDQGNFLADLGSITGTGGIEVFGLNDNGVAVGTAYYRGAQKGQGGNYTQAVLFNGVAQLIGPLAPNQSTQGVAINNAGQVVGNTSSSSKVAGSENPAFFWDSVNGVRLVPDAGYGSQITALNQNGVACGDLEALIPGTTSLSIDCGTFTPTSYTDMGLLPTSITAIGLGIDSAGDVVGYSDLGPNNHAVLYTGGTIQDLGGLPSTSPFPDSRAVAINDSGVIVGFTDVGIGSFAVIDDAWVLINGTMYDLNTLAPVAGDTLGIPFALNENGQILVEGGNAYYVLSPINSVTVAATPAAAGSVSGSGTFPVGSPVIVTATPIAGATFVNWTSNGSPVSTSASYSFTMAGSVNLVANFAYLPAGLTVNPTHITGGTSTTATLNLGGAAATSTTFNLSANPASAINMPAGVTVAAGSAQATFTITGNPVSTSTIERIAAAAGALTFRAKFTVQPPTLLSLKSNGSQTGGTPVSLTLTLTGNAGPGYQVTLTSSDPSVDVSSSPLTVTHGASSLTFSLPTNPVLTNTTVHISAMNGTSTRTCTVGVRAPALKKLSFTPTKGVGGVYAPTGTVLLNGPVAADTVVTLSSNDPSVHVPASVKVLAGTPSITFSATTASVSAQKLVTISATLGTVTKTFTVTVQP